MTSKDPHTSKCHELRRWYLQTILQMKRRLSFLALLRTQLPECWDEEVCAGLWRKIRRSRPIKPRDSFFIENSTFALARIPSRTTDYANDIQTSPAFWCRLIFFSSNGTPWRQSARVPLLDQLGFVVERKVPPEFCAFLLCLL